MASFPPGSSYSPQPQSRAHKIHTPQTTPPQPPRPWPQVSGSLPTWGSPEGDRSPVGPQDKARLLRCPQLHTTPPWLPPSSRPCPLDLRTPANRAHTGPDPTLPVPADLCLSVPFAWNPLLASSPSAWTSLSRSFPALPQAGSGALLWGLPPPPQPYSPHTGQLIRQLPARPGALLCGCCSAVERFRVAV